MITKPRIQAITPFILFVSIYIASHLFFKVPISPLVACTISVIYAIYLIPSLPLNDKVQLFLHGSANNTVLAMCYIFILSSVFTYVLKLIGGIDNTISLGLFLIPNNWILPGFFVVVSLFATAIGSSMGSIAAFMPIATGLANSLGISPALLAGITVSGAMLGDNLSLISDTTIAATQTTNTTMSAKFKENILLVIPAFFITIGILFWISGTLTLNVLPPIVPPTLTQLISILPYGVLFFCALYGIDVIAVLVISIITGIVIGLALNQIQLKQCATIILDGFIDAGTGMQEVLILSLLISGLSYLVEYNGGIEYILKKMSTHITSSRSAEFHIALLIFLVNAAIAINTIAILVTGPIAKKIADFYKIPSARIASLLDTISCFCQGILPYAPQLLLAGSLAGISSTSIMPYLHYQWAILMVTMASIFYTPARMKK